MEKLYTVSKTRLGADCGSDHELLIAKFRLRLKGKSLEMVTAAMKLWYIYTMEYYSAIKKNTFESVLMRWMKLEPIYTE